VIEEKEKDDEREWWCGKIRKENVAKREIVEKT